MGNKWSKLGPKEKLKKIGKFLTVKMTGRNMFSMPSLLGTRSLEILYTFSLVKAKRVDGAIGATNKGSN